MTGCPPKGRCLGYPRLETSRTGPLAGLAILLFCACATPSAPFEGHPVLKGIRFEGNKNISGSDLESKIATAPTSGFFSKTARYYDDDLFRIDEKRIVRWYNEKGFYEAKVEDARVEHDREGRVTLVVQIHEGPRAKVKQVVLASAGNIGKDEQDDLRDRLPLKAGDDFDEGKYELGKQALVRLLQDHGFARAAVTGKVLVAPEEAIATITYEVKSGPRFTFGRVLVSGNRAVATDEIIRAAGIDRGEPFKQSKLELAQQRIYNLGAFSGVRVGLEPFGETPVASVRVNVREAPFQTLRLGLGFEAESARYEIPRLRAEYTNRNLLGGLRRLELTTQLGYAFTPTITNPAGPVTLTTAQLVTPNVLFPGLDFIVRTEFAREVLVGFSYDQLAARTSFLYRRGYHAVAPSLNFVYYFDSALALDGTLNNLSNLLIKGGSGAAAFISNCLPSCTLLYPEIRYTFDLRDNVVEPRKGVYFTLSLQQTLKPGSFTYFRIEPELRGYLSLSPTVVAAGRAYFGALIQPPGTAATASPFQQRFFGGGYSGNRGFSPQGQSPRIGARFNRDGYANTSVPIGGNGDFLLSGELRISTDALLRHTAIVPFLDASRVTVDPKLPFTVPLELAPGLGLRYQTPFGPVRLDVGFLLHSFEVIAQPPLVAGQVFPLFPPPLRPTPVSTGCDQGTGTCISQSRFAFHLALGEAY
ncbi:MAG: outer membrane protein assembly factor BamA [Myxococcales bacterium]